ncbi:conserved hypothetical protein [Gammaproteobacteria bacterium]
MKTPRIGHYRCPLGRRHALPPEPEDLKRQGWREQHLLVVSDADERLDFIEREIVRRIGERLYGGKRNA